MGNRIKIRRKELRIKQAELAERLNISNSHMSSIENGRQKPSLDIFIQICNRQAARASRSPAGQTSVRSRTSRALSSFSERVRMSVFDFMSYGLSTGNGGMFLTDQQIFFLRRASRIFCTAWPRCTSRVLTEI